MNTTKKQLLTVLLCAGFTFYASASAALNIGDTAPALNATDIFGKKVDLHAIKGVTVLEWSNPQCPFVKKHYTSNNMQKLQESAKKDGVTWIMINSSAPGKQGHMDHEQAKKLISEQKASPAHVILDADGAIGKAFGAKTTPHMYVIHANHTIAYMGAIDSKNGVNPDEIPSSTNYVQGALNALKAGTTPNPSATAPYGCGIKYAH
ncbi:MAG: thioredoxin family protein [Alphaproteobacteria bacterium]|nr:MAG: thioredoxin family protein [Alphaproteobacteria bacterium]